jgi:hypothetical protein
MCAQANEEDRWELLEGLVVHVQNFSQVRT